MRRAFSGRSPDTSAQATFLALDVRCSIWELADDSPLRRMAGRS
ncbi:hypothetical protein [Granulimonas faecalis]|nr:hypothetical protein [Granulimonas faecalis]